MLFHGGVNWHAILKRYIEKLCSVAGGEILNETCD